MWTTLTVHTYTGMFVIRLGFGFGNDFTIGKITKSVNRKKEYRNKRKTKTHERERQKKNQRRHNFGFWNEINIIHIHDPNTQ